MSLQLDIQEVVEATPLSLLSGTLHGLYNEVIKFWFLVRNTSMQKYFCTTQAAKNFIVDVAT